MKPLPLIQAFTRWPALLAAVVAAGCIGSGSAPTRFYVLNPVPDSGGVAAAGLRVEIRAVRLPQYLERPQIVTRSGENRLELAEFDQWGGNLRKNVTRVMAQNLSRLLGTAEVAISPHGFASGPDVSVEVEVMAFEQGSDGRVRLSAQWRLFRGADRLPIRVRVADLTGPPVPAGPDYTATVAAMSTLIGELSGTIAEAIREFQAEGTAS